MFNRRDMGRLALGGAAAAGLAGRTAFAQAKLLPTQIAGHEVGTCFFNYRSLPRGADQMAYVDSILDAIVQTGIGRVEIGSNNLEPANDLPFTGLPRVQDDVHHFPGPWDKRTRAELDGQREDLRKWRLDPANLPYFAEVAKRMRARGLQPYSYVMTFLPDTTDAEIDAIFRHAKALGVTCFSTNQTKVEMAPKLVAPAERHGIDVAFHNHTLAENPDEFASVASFERVFPLSPRFRINLDIGQAAAADVNCMEFLRRFPEKITHLHIKDKKWHQGASVPLGEGDTPVREVIIYIKEKGWQFPLIPEIEYAMKDGPVVETRRCLDFIRQTLTA